VALFWVCGATLAQEPSARNLIPNGDFEQGTTTPARWQTIDGLTSFWVQDDDPKHGKVMEFDTDVLQSQAYEWWAKIVAGASPKDAPGKQPTREPKYDTLAGLDGVWFYSDFVPVEKDKSYWLTVDVKGCEFMLWLLGYANKTNEAFGAEDAALQGYLQQKAGDRDIGRGHKRFVHGFDWKGQMKAGGSSEWKTYSRREKPFRPTANTPQVRYVRILLLPLWPAGTYYVDNVRLTGMTAREGADTSMFLDRGSPGGPPSP
jgi:hypothetical protein